MPVAFRVGGPLILRRDAHWLLQDTHHHGARAPSIHDASSPDKPKHSMLFQSCSQLENYRLTVPYQGQVSGGVRAAARRVGPGVGRQAGTR